MSVSFQHRFTSLIITAFVLCSCSAIKPTLKNELNYDNNGKVNLLCVYSGSYKMPARETVITNMTDFANAICSNGINMHHIDVSQKEKMFGAKQSTAQMSFSCIEGEASKFGSPEHLLCSSMFIDTDAVPQKDVK